MVNWHCSSSLCFNNYSNVKKKCKEINYYRLPADVQLQRQYQSILKTTGMNWKFGYICSEHWSTGVRSCPSSLPDVPVTIETFEVIKKKYENAKRNYQKARTLQKLRGKPSKLPKKNS